MKYNVMCVAIEGRKSHAVDVQKILTENGCSINARLGLAQHHEGVCSSEGLVILQLTGNTEDIEKVKSELNGVDGVKADYISI
jgi:riboflavin synthase